MDEEEDNPTLLDTLPQDVDISDETQDYRFLSVFANSSTDQAAIPKRGEKDFEPDGTSHQDDILAHSRRAMYSALSAPLPGVPTTIGVWRLKEEMSSVADARGSFLKTMGKQDREGTVWLLPEETIYLVERGTMQCFWENGVPMDLAGVYSACLTLAGGVERYLIYSYLRRAGYAIKRAPEWAGPLAASKKSVLGWLWDSGMYWNSFVKTFSGLGDLGGNKPILKKGVYRSYADIYRKLEVIPRYVAPSAANKAKFVPTSAHTENPFRLTYHIWKPNGPFKKSAPREPDFRLAVVDARSTNFPSLKQISGLFESVPYTDADHGKKSAFFRFKEGSRNVILAIFDSGITSFLRLSDSEFGAEKMYRQLEFRAQKGPGSRGPRPPRQQGAGPNGNAKGKEKAGGKADDKKVKELEVVAVISTEGRTQEDAA